mgnify:CR=1 FL=1
MRTTCKGKPSANNYSNGCRCADCREAWRIYSEEYKASKRRPKKTKSKPITYSDAFTREEILKARGMM